MSSEPSLLDVELLIKALDSRVRSEKTRASEALIKKQVYPVLISDINVFFEKILKPIVKNISNDTERVREHCILCTGEYMKQIGNKNLNVALNLVMSTLFERLKPGVEPAEHIKLIALKLILDLISMVSTESNQQNCDDFVLPMIHVLKSSFGSNDADMKKISCQVLNELIEKSTKKAIQPLGGLLMRSILPNCVHRHNEIRKISLKTLCNLLIITGYYDDIINIDAVLQRLVNDRNSGVRKEVINFCREILVRHPMKHVVHYPLIIHLLYFVAPLVPKRKVYNEILIKNDPQTDEALMSFDALVQIGKEYENNNDFNLQYFNETFDETGRKIPKGLIKIIQDIFPKLMNHLIPMISDWTETKRIIGYESMRTLLHLSFGYEIEYIPQIIHEVLISLHDFKEESEMILQIISIMASNIESKEIISILVPKLKANDSKKEILLILTTIIINGKISDNELLTIFDAILSVESDLIEESIDYLTQILLSMINKSKSFVNTKTIPLLKLTINICEKSNAINIFTKFYPIPISEIVSENIKEFLELKDLSPSFLKILFNFASAESILLNQKKINSLLLNLYPNYPDEISQILQDLSMKKALKDLDEEFIQITTNKESIHMIKCLMENDSYNKNALDSKKSIILNVISESLKSKQTADRIDSLETIKLFLQKIKFDEEQFKLIYSKLLEGLKDNCNSIVILSSSILATFLIDYQSYKGIDDYFNEICITIDDEDESIRKSISSLLKKLCSIDKWKETITSILNTQNNYHVEAKEECKNIVSAFSK